MKVTLKHTLTLSIAAGLPESAIIQAIASATTTGFNPGYSGSAKVLMDAILLPGMITAAGDSALGFLSIWRRVGTILNPQLTACQGVSSSIEYIFDQWANPVFAQETGGSIVGVVQSLAQTATGQASSRFTNSVVAAIQPTGLGYNIYNELTPSLFTSAWPASTSYGAPCANVSQTSLLGYNSGGVTNVVVFITQVYNLALPYNQSAVGAYSGLTLSVVVPETINASAQYAGTPATADVYSSFPNFGKSVLVLPIMNQIINTATSPSLPLIIGFPNLGAGTVPPAVTGSVVSSLATSF